VDVINMKTANALGMPLALLAAQTRWSNRCCLLHYAMSLLAHRDASLRGTNAVAIRGIADMPGASRTSGYDATDPKRS